MPGQTRIDRRTVLRGLGTAVALPLLEAMQGAVRGAEETPPVRMAFLYVPNGAHMPDWTPGDTGADFELSPILVPLRPYKKHLTVLSGLTNDGARAHGDGGGGHARAVAAFLTGAHPKKTKGADIRNDKSADQVAAEAIGRHTRFPSLELGTEPSIGSGSCDDYACPYLTNISWRSPTAPMGKEIDPRRAFDRLFGNRRPHEEREAKARRMRYQASLLDAIAEDANRLQQKLGAADRRKLEEYLYAVRETERRLATPAAEKSLPEGTEPPAAAPGSFDSQCRAMFDVMTLAWQCDLTRIITFMYANGQNDRRYVELGAERGHHELSHHGNNHAWHVLLSKINRYHVSLLAYWLENLSNVREGDGNLLDHSMIVYGSGLSDGDKHNSENLPILLLGQGGGSIPGNRHLAFPMETPLANLYLAMFDRVGLPAAKFANSTGRLKLE